MRSGASGVGFRFPLAYTLFFVAIAPESPAAFAGEAPCFVRGDVNSDGVVDLFDAAFLNDYLALGGVAPPCSDAADTNDSGELSPSDITSIVNWLFHGDSSLAAPAPSAPFYAAGDCQVDPTPDDLDCGEFPMASNPPRSETRFRIDFTSDEAVVTRSGEEVIVEIAEESDTVQLQFEVVLESNAEPCVTRPDLCTGGESVIERDATGFAIRYGCADREDNDGDGLIDLQDPDCHAIRGWSFTLDTGNGEGLSPEFATTRATVAAREPDGRRLDASFERTSVLDSQSGGATAGVVSSVMLSWFEPVSLPRLGSWAVLRGGFSVRPGDPPARIRIQQPDEPGYPGAGQTVRTMVIVGDHVDAPLVDSVTLSVVASPARFRRGDSNGDGIVDIADASHLFGCLFLGSDCTRCPDAADSNDDGTLDVSDGIRTLGGLFLGFPLPPTPGVQDCGEDPTEDALPTCHSRCL